MNMVKNQLINIYGKKIFSIQLTHLPLEFDSLNFDLVVNELVDVGDHSPALDVHQDEGGNHLVVQRAVRTWGKKDNGKKRTMQR